MSFVRPLSRSFGLAALLFLLVTAQEGAFGAKPSSSLLDANLKSTFALMQNQNDPVAAKLVTWLYVTETKIPVHAPDLMEFARQNANWPRLHEFREKIEDGIASAAKPPAIVEWFSQNPPEHYRGIKAYVNALLATGQNEKAKAALQKFWRETDIDRDNMASLAGSYKNLLTAQDHYARMDKLIWEAKYGEAEYMLAFVSADKRTLGHARIALGRISSKADAALAAVPKALQNDEGLLFERMRYRRRKDMDAGALEILGRMPQNAAKPEMWWREISILARRKIEERDYKGAYAIAKKHTLTSGIEYAQAEWLLGWLALRGLHKPTDAYGHFDALYRNVQSAISKSRAAYWAARTAEAMPNAVLAGDWDKISALYPSTYYGQLSYAKLHGAPTSKTLAEAPVPPEVSAQFEKNELVRAARLLHKTNLAKFIDPFLAKLLKDAKSGHDYYLTAKLARETGRLYYAVEANKEAQQMLGVFLMTEGYPLMPQMPVSEPEKSLVHAIIHRESMFDTNALSSAGARGLMQLMPGTAKMMSKRKGRTYKLEKLTEDPQFNVTLGAAYLDQMLDLYGGFYPMAIAAYNAGPGRVAEWNKLFGDPRKSGGMDVIDWVEHIPIYETRNYVQRVMESYYMYRLRFGLPPKTIEDFVP